MLTEIGPVEIDVPRDTGSTFDPQIVKKRQRRLTGIHEIVLSLSAKGLTTGEIAAHFGEVFGTRVSKDTISRITEKVTAEMTEWQNRPLDRVYPVVFIDAIFRRGPRRSGHEPAGLRCDRRQRQRQRRTGHPRVVGRGWRGRREVLALCPDGNQEPRFAARARAHFPTEQAALTCLYLATRALDPTGKGRARWATRWKPALIAFAITFEGRIN